MRAYVLVSYGRYTNVMITLAVAAIGLFVYMSFAFALAVYMKDNGVADIAYGCAFILLSWVTYTGESHPLAGLIATILATVWGLRLATRIYFKNRYKPEDFRYKKWREEWGKSFLVRSYFQVFMLQGIIIFIIALPVMLLNVYTLPVALTWVSLLGVLVWLKGFFFEAVGDYQLDRFLKDSANKGHIMQKGLWHFTRHPNYFGESLMWWGIGLLAYGELALVWGYTVALVAFVSPVLITFLLLRVSGVPLLEEHFSGPEWEAYKARTSVFIPWFPKRKQA